MILEVVRPGIHTAVQDLGRPGSRKYGIATGGALDLVAARMANLLVGNTELDAVVETAFSGLRIRFTDDRTAAWCGAAFDVLRNGDPIPAGRAFGVHAGDELSFRGPVSGVRAWLAISGGIDVPLVLGSRATDLRAGFGGFHGRALREGDRLPLAPESGASRRVREILGEAPFASWGAAADLVPRSQACGVVRVIRGLEWVRFSARAHADFFEKTFTVTPESDRMGLRFSGPSLESADSHPDMISQGTVPGTIQVPPQGQPIVLLADCQTIGGYPRIAHVITADFPLLAQLRPGEAIQFREVALEEARALVTARESAFDLLRTGLLLRLG